MKLNPAPPLSKRAQRGARNHLNSLRDNALSGIRFNARGEAEIRRGHEAHVEKSAKVSVSGLERMFLGLQSRVEAIHGGQVLLDLKEWIEGSLEGIHTAEFLKDRGDMIMAAAGGDKESQQFLAALNVAYTRNFILASSNWALFFDNVTLADDETPVFSSEVGHEIRVDAIGQNGGMTTIQAQLDKSEFYVPLMLLSTGWYEYVTADLYKGSSVRSLALANVDLARDMAYKIDSLLGSNILRGSVNTRLVANFTTTGPELGRDYVAHSRVQTGNLPVGNLITLTGNSTSSKFRKEVFDAAIEYCSRWGTDVMPDGGLTPVAIHVASINATDFLSQVGLTSDGTNPMNKQIFEGGAVVNYAGYKFVVIADNTIDPNDGCAYVRLNKPIGNYYDKPSMDLSLTDENADLKLLRKGRTALSRAVGFGLPLHWRKHTLGIVYRTPV